MCDEFVGRTFGENDQVEVISWGSERSGRDKAYTIKCHECAKDPCFVW